MYKPFAIALLFFQQAAFATIDNEISSTYNETSGYIEVKYTVSSTSNKTSIVLQRSTNNFTWQDINTQKIKQRKLVSRIFLLTDRNPEVGKSYYRVKLIDIENKLSYSTATSITMNEPKDDWVIYPNPVHDVLTLQYKGVAVFKGVLNIFIYNASGTIIARRRFASNQRMIQIPVAEYTKGIYIIRIFVQDELVAYEQFSKM